jgi:uncharacterized ParB-like nuclease family protein
MEHKTKEGLSDEDLGIALVDVVLKAPPRKSRTIDALVFTVEYKGKDYRFGVIGERALESLKKHGYKDENGKIHFTVPQTVLKEPIGWINEAY